MEQDSGVTMDVLKVDGGVTANDFAMQLQADVLGIPVSRPVVAETTALGAAYAAGLAVGFWADTEELTENWQGPALAARLGRRTARRRLPAVAQGHRSQPGVDRRRGAGRNG